MAAQKTDYEVELPVVGRVIEQNGPNPGTGLVKQADIMKYLPDFNPGIEQDEIQKSIDRLSARTDLTPEDQRILAAYQAVQEGRQLVSLGEAIARGGQTPETLPKLAVTAYGLSGVRCTTEVNGTVNFRDPRPDAEGWSKRKMRREQPWSWSFSKLFGRAAIRGGTARTPYIPPEHRPEDPSGKLVFWEAAWSMDEVPEPRPRVVIDPAILEHVVGDLYRVVSCWDLTPVEAAALDG